MNTMNMFRFSIHKGVFQGPPEFRKDLAEAERIGLKAIEEVVNAAMKEENLDYDRLMALSKALLEGADSANCKNNKALTGTYLFLYHNLWEYAKNHLEPKDYHRFCGNQIDHWQELYQD